MKAIFTFLFLILVSLGESKSTPVFHIECPSDVTVKCDDEIWDLSIYGQAYIYGYGDPIPADSPVVEYFLNSCDVGKIIRTWTASDYSGNVYTCSQTITVKSNVSLDSLNIQWPPDYTVNDCSAELDPTSLPEPYNYPDWHADGCIMIMKNFTDKVFEVDNGCKKVLRKWKLIDWCTYDPNDPYTKGVWEHTQILKVMSTERPVIDCIQDLTVSAGSSCYSTYIDLPEVTATNSCNSEIGITNNSPYANEEGNNASGFYPLGTTMIKFTARDACGNESICKVSVTVVDQKLPVPICLHGISATLAIHRDGYYVKLYPELFNKGSYDNCTPNSKLKIRVEPEILTCDDLDTTPVKLIVTDEEGNSNYCETYVYLTDNQDKCPSNGTFTAKGKIISSVGIGASEFDLSFIGQNQVARTKTNSQGEFSVDGLSSENTYTVSPIYKAEGRSGWSTKDEILMYDVLNRKYHPYMQASLAAADIDGDNTFSDLDIYLHKRILLGELEMGDHGKYVQLVNTSVPFADPFTIPAELYDVRVDNDITGSAIRDLMMIKTGDLDGSYFEVVEERSGEPLIINSDIRELKKGSINKVRLKVGTTREFLGYQYTLQFDPEKVDHLDINYQETNYLSKSDFGFENKKDGIILCSFINEEGLTFNDEDVFLSLNISVREDVAFSEVIKINDEVLTSEIYGKDYSQSPIIFEVGSTASSGQLISDVNMIVYPNPLSPYSNVEFFIPSYIDETQAYFQILGVDGKRYFELDQELHSGPNRLNFSTGLMRNLPSGLIIMQLVTNKGIISKRVIKL